MKDIILISSYDSGYCFSIMVNGKIIHKSDDEEENIADKVRSKYYHCFSSEFKEFCKKEFGTDKQIIVCEDGDIELLWNQENY